jgi:anthranilate synthase component 1
VLGTPDILLMRPTIIVVFDAVRDEITVVTPVRPRGRPTQIRPTPARSIG